MRTPTGLLELLITGATAIPPWSDFLENLRTALCADYASIVFRPLPLGEPQTRVVHLASGAQSPPMIAQFYRDRLYKEDPLPYFDLAEGEVHALEKLMSADNAAHELYRREFVEPSGMNVLRIVRVREAGGVNAWLSVSRRSGNFSASEMALLTSLVPTFRAALSNCVALDRERTKAAVAADAIRRMHYGWLTLDRRGHILDADAQAEKVLKESKFIARSKSGRLVARDSIVMRDVTASLASITAGGNVRPRAVVLNRDPWLDMLLVPAALPDGAAGPAPSAIAYVHSEGVVSAYRCEQLCQIFDLIPSEARLALALSRGMTIAEAAASLDLTVESARTYSKRIYAKTGARGQTDLIRFIHRSVVTMA